MDLLVTGFETEMHVVDRGKTVDFSLQTTVGACRLHLTTALALVFLRLLRQLTAAAAEMAAAHGEPLSVEVPPGPGIRADAVRLLMPREYGDPTLEFRPEDGPEILIRVSPAILIDMAEQLQHAADYIRNRWAGPFRN
jgi:hypothetical protein